MPPPISIIIPVYNEQENIAPLVKELKALQETFNQLEVFIVDDGSTDDTYALLECEARSFPQLTPLKIEVNQGQSLAMLKGLHTATNEVLVLLDGDLQNDPADIVKLVEEVDSADVVCGYRAKRKDSASKRIASKLANNVRNLITRDGLRDTGCSLKAFKRECLNDLPSKPGMHRFMGAYFKLNGRVIKQIPVNHRPRMHGESKYTNMKRLPKTIKDLFGFIKYRNNFKKQSR